MAIDNAGYDTKVFEPGDVAKLMDVVGETCIRGELGVRYVRKVGRPSVEDVEAYDAAENGEVLFNTNDPEEPPADDDKGGDKDKPNENTANDPPENTNDFPPEVKNPPHVGRGLYLMPDGTKVKGKAAATEMADAIWRAEILSRRE